MDFKNFSKKLKIMDKKNIAKALIQSYEAFTTHIKGLSASAFMFSYQEKWTAGQQLHHLVVCVKPLVKFFDMPKEMIAQNFGSPTHANISYQDLKNTYIQKLQEGGKAPSRFLPEMLQETQKNEFCGMLNDLIATLNAKVDTFTETELDTLCVPHPLLGNLTIREMLYNTIYHAEHHQQQIELYLKDFQG